MTDAEAQRKLKRDFSLTVMSLLIAVILARTGVFEGILTSTQGMRFLGSFIAGMFFTSLFTTFPAMVILGEIAVAAHSPLFVAFFGGLGALVGDYVIFRFVRDNVADDIKYILSKSRNERMRHIFKRRLFRWVVPLAGAIAIASPLPDELGLALLGLSKVKTSLFMPLSFTLNFVGILIVALIARGLS